MCDDASVLGQSLGLASKFLGRSKIMTLPPSFLIPLSISARVSFEPPKSLKSCLAPLYLSIAIGLEGSH